MTVSDWFLPEAEAPWTGGNLVIPHVHGVEYFARLLEVVPGTRAGDRIFFTDWRGDSDERLAEDGPTVASCSSPQPGAASRSAGCSGARTVTSSGSRVKRTSISGRW